MPDPGRERFAVAALAILAPVIFWGCLETGARLAGVSPLSEDEKYVTYTAQRNCRFGWRAFETACAAKHFEHGNDRLLVTLGGSSVHGFPLGRPSFAPMLGDLLKRGFGTRWRVVNRGFACKNSYFLQGCAHRALAAGADVLVIYAGHNDFAAYGPWDPSRLIWLERHAWIYDLEVWLAKSRAFSALIGLMRADAAPRWFPPQPSPDQIAEAQGVVLEAFTERVMSVIDAAAAHEARVILATVVSNLYDHPVKRKDWDSSPFYDVDARPDLANWAEHYRAGIAQHRAGNFEHAYALFSTARDNFMHGRAPSVLNARVREIAAAHSHVELVDVEKLLLNELEEGIGCNFFGDEGYCDQFHPNARTHQMIAGAMFRKMREMGLTEPPARPRR